MFFLITGDDLRIDLWHKAICSAIEFREVKNAYYVFHTNPKIKSEIEKLISHLGCDDYCELSEHDDFKNLGDNFIIYSISENHNFYDFCQKCHEDADFAKSMEVGNICVGERAFYDKRMGNRFAFEIISLFCVINFILAYLLFFR